MSKLQYICIFALILLIPFPQATAQNRDIGCVGPLPGAQVGMIDFLRGRPLQREIFQGCPVRQTALKRAPSSA